MKVGSRKEGLDLAKRKSKEESCHYVVVKSKEWYYVEQTSLPGIGYGEVLVAMFFNGLRSV